MALLKKLPWNETIDFSKPLWQKIPPKELKERIENYPLTRKLLKKTLLQYIEEIIPTERGYCLLPLSAKTFALFVQENPSDFHDFETGIIHELTHLIYRVQGNATIKSDNNNLIERIVEEASQKFQKNNAGYISKKLEEIFKNQI